MAEFVKIDFTAKADGKVFDTTLKDVAQKENIYSDKVKYSPLPVIVGDGQVIPGLEDALRSMKKGEEKTVKIPPEKAFGKRDPKLVSVIPESVFKNNKITPVPGMPIQVEGKTARVLSVSSGRVQIDFNHELAGKEVEYWVKVVSKAETEEEKLEILSSLAFPDIKTQIKTKEKTVELILPTEARKLNSLELRKTMFAELVKKHLGKEKVRITEEY